MLDAKLLCRHRFVSLASDLEPTNVRFVLISNEVFCQMYPTYNRNSRHNDQRLVYSWPGSDVGNKTRSLPDYWTGKDWRHHMQELTKKTNKSSCSERQKKETLMLNFKRHRNLPANYYCMRWFERRLLMELLRNYGLQYPVETEIINLFRQIILNTLLLKCLKKTAKLPWIVTIITFIMIFYTKEMFNFSFSHMVMEILLITNETV